MIPALSAACALLLAMSGSSAIPDSVLQAQAPDDVIERAQQVLVARLGDQVGATCRVTTEGPIVTITGSKFSGISGWQLRVRFRPDPAQDLECKFVADEGDLRRSHVETHQEGRVVFYGDVPDCRHQPELCAIRIDAAAAVELGKSRGIDPGDPSYSAVLELSYLEAGFLWRITSRAEGERYGRLVIVDALTGDILVDGENRPCPE